MTSVIPFLWVTLLITGTTRRVPRILSPSKSRNQSCSGGMTARPAAGYAPGGRRAPEGLPGWKARLWWPAMVEGAPLEACQGLKARPWRPARIEGAPLEACQDGRHAPGGLPGCARCSTVPRSSTNTAYSACKMQSATEAARTPKTCLRPAIRTACWSPLPEGPDTPATTQSSTAPLAGRSAPPRPWPSLAAPWTCGDAGPS